MQKCIEKVLSRNDTGETGTNQAGLLIPKVQTVLSFFPLLERAAYNPRVVIDMVDDAGQEWTFNLIYYNNALCGGTRNEYRLTGMTAFMRMHSLREGDTLVFCREDERVVRVSYRRKNVLLLNPSTGRRILKLSGSWRMVEDAERED
jgi:hypothetical protein